MEQERPKLKFFIDRGLGRNVVPEAIRRIGYEAVIHDDIFEQETSDTDWLNEIGKLGLVFLSKDQHIEKNPAVLSRMPETSGVWNIPMGLPFRR